MKGRTLGPLHGIPITIKDAFDTASVRSTAGGTKGRADYVPQTNAPTVERLSRERLSRLMAIQSFGYKASFSVLIGIIGLAGWRRSAP